ncbi:MAG: NAD(P)/FAD-dependent oxidoreductase [Candidatus Hecatellaceae archaeon]
MRETYDLIVVGAGPGGSLAAKTAAEKGFKVIMLERGRRPGDKNVGGELLTQDVFHLFPWMREGPVERPITRWSFHFYHEDGRLVEAGLSRSRPYGYTVHRPAWDFWVSKAAVEAGAKLETARLVEKVLFNGEGFAVGVETSRGEKFYGSVVVGADGVNSVVARDSGLRGKWPPESLALAVKHTYRLGEKRVSERFTRGGACEVVVVLDGRIPNGYGWVFPSRRNVAVGVGVTVDRPEKPPAAYLKKMLKLPPVQERIKGGRLAERSARTLPVGAPAEKTFGDGLLLVGDAAGFTCPMEGAGYEAAAYSGRLAAEVACEALGRGDVSAEALSSYEKRWRESWIGVNLDFGREIQKLIVEEMGIERFNRFLYGFLASATKHGSFPGLSHREAFLKFVEENSELLAVLGGKLLGFLKL